MSSRRGESGCLHLQWSPLITCEHICHTWSLLRSTSRPLCASRTALGGSRQACLLVCHTTTDIRVDLRPSPASWPIRGRTARRPASFDSCSSEKLMILPGRASLINSFLGCWVMMIKLIYYWVMVRQFYSPTPRRVIKAEQQNLLQSTTLR